MKKNNKSTTQFNKDLKWGEYWEFELNRFIEPLFKEQYKKKNLIFSFSTLRSSNIFPDKKDWYKYDTLYHVYEQNNNDPIRQITFEIKADKYDNTGNICIERKCSRKDSGVFHTEADYFIYFMPRYVTNNLYIFKPKELTIFLEKYNHDLRYVGDGNRSYSYIINKHEFDQDIRENKIGKIYTYESHIPDYFNIDKFDEVKTTTYFSNKMNKYDDDLL